MSVGETLRFLPGGLLYPLVQRAANECLKPLIKSLARTTRAFSDEETNLLRLYNVDDLGMLSVFEDEKKFRQVSVLVLYTVSADITFLIKLAVFRSI